MLNLVSVHGTLKLENRNWKFGLHIFVLFQMIVLSDSPRCSEPFCSISKFLLSNFKFQAVNGYSFS
jgi:hypothetical protein